MTITETRNEERVGIDFGNTIGTIENGPAPFAYEMVSHLVHKFQARNVFVVSKAGPSMEHQIRQCLEETQFYRVTGFLLENVIFVRNYEDKANVVQSKGISIFFDDHFKVIKVLATLLSMRRIFWMQADWRELQMIDKNLRHKISITSKWQNVMKFMQRIPTKN